jgi:hypothetical protein
LGEVNGGLGWRCALSVVVWSAALVAHGVGHNVVGFSAGAGKVVRGEVGSVGFIDLIFVFGDLGFFLVFPTLFQLLVSGIVHRCRQR